MANITIRNLPDDANEALRIQAAQSGVSLEAYARNILQKASSLNGFEPVDILESAEQYFGVRGGLDIILPKRDSKRDQVDFNR